MVLAEAVSLLPFRERSGYRELVFIGESGEEFALACRKRVVTAAGGYRPDAAGGAAWLNGAKS